MPILETIAMLCQVSACSGAKVEEIQSQQAKCQSYFVQCLEKSKSGKYRYDDSYNLEVCIASRPAQLMLDRAGSK